MEELKFKEGLRDILKAERKKLKLTQELMAEIMQVDYKTYQSWELMTRSIKLHSMYNVVQRLADKSKEDKRFESIIKALKDYIF